MELLFNFFATAEPHRIAHLLSTQCQKFHQNHIPKTRSLTLRLESPSWCRHSCHRQYSKDRPRMCIHTNNANVIHLTCNCAPHQSNDIVVSFLCLRCYCHHHSYIKCYDYVHSLATTHFSHQMPLSCCYEGNPYSGSRPLGGYSRHTLSQIHLSYIYKIRCVSKVRMRRLVGSAPSRSCFLLVSVLSLLRSLFHCFLPPLLIVVPAPRSFSLPIPALSLLRSLKHIPSQPCSLLTTPLFLDCGISQLHSLLTTPLLNFVQIFYS